MTLTRRVRVERLIADLGRLGDMILADIERAAWDSAILKVPSSERIDFVIAYADEIERAGQLRAAVYGAWAFTESPSLVAPLTAARLFRRAGYFVVGADDVVVAGEAPSQPLVVYRGVRVAREHYARHLSWTTDVRVARWFAARFAPPDGGVVYRATAARVLARIDGRSEAEVIVDPRSLCDLDVVETGILQGSVEQPWPKADIPSPPPSSPRVETRPYAAAARIVAYFASGGATGGDPRSLADPMGVLLNVNTDPRPMARIAAQAHRELRMAPPRVSRHALESARTEAESRIVLAVRLNLAAGLAELGPTRWDGAWPTDGPASESARDIDRILGGVLARGDAAALPAVKAAIEREERPRIRAMLDALWGQVVRVARVLALRGEIEDADLATIADRPEASMAQDAMLSIPSWALPIREALRGPYPRDPVPAWLT